MKFTFCSDADPTMISEIKPFLIFKLVAQIKGLKKQYVLTKWYKMRMKK